MQNVSDLVQREHFQIRVEQRWVGKIGDFQPINRRMSETVRDRAKVTIDH